jgi:uncharacterized iron-regulated protein
MHLNRRTILRLAAAVALLPAAARQPLANAARTWVSPHFAGNPAVGKVFDQAGPTSLTFADVVARTISARYVMLGEIHSNPDHHLLQAEALAAMIKAGRQPAVVFEMVPRLRQPVLDEMMASPPADSNVIATKLDWANSGWPDFALYEPLFTIALENGLAIKAGNIDRDLVRRMAGREGPPLTDEERARYSAQPALPASAAQDLLRVIKVAHCNMLPDTVLPMMRDIQRARDAVMAAAMLDPTNTDGAVLIAGSGHARLDWGAGQIVDQAAPGELLSIAFAEVSDETSEARQDWASHHFTIMTPRYDVTDHCEQFGKPKSPG